MRILDRFTTPEQKELLKKVVIIEYEGVNGNNPNAFSEHSLGAYAIAKDDGKKYLDIQRDSARAAGKTRLNEDRALAREITDKDGNIVGFDLYAIDAVGGNSKFSNRAAEIAAEEFARDPRDYGELVARIKQRYTSEGFTIHDGACWAGVKIRGDECEISRQGDCRVTVWDEEGKKMYSTDDQSPGRSLGIDSYYDPNSDTPSKITLLPGWTVEICTDGRVKNRNDEEELEVIRGEDFKSAAHKSYKETDRKMYFAPGGSPDNQTAIIYCHKGNKDVPAKVAPCYRDRNIQDLAQAEIANGRPFMSMEEGVYRGYFKRKNKRLDWHPDNLQTVPGCERTYPLSNFNYAVNIIDADLLEKGEDLNAALTSGRSRTKTALLLAGGLALAGATVTTTAIGVSNNLQNQSESAEVTEASMERTAYDLMRSIESNDKEKLSTLIIEAERQIKGADTEEEIPWISTLSLLKDSAERRLSK